MYKPIQSVTLPQALNSDYLTTMAIRYVDSIVDIVENFNDEENLQQKIKYLAGKHTNCGLTVAHFVVSLQILCICVHIWQTSGISQESVDVKLPTFIPT
ncbi:unnamed protein product [Trichobilharzia regenti]|nr:unnamed protein product [Trichobilharzia regenti]